MADPTGNVQERPDRLSRNFSEQLKGAFNLGGELPSLSEKIEQKKQEILSERHELHKLEARIEATEEALARAGANLESTSYPQAQHDTTTTSSTSQEAILGKRTENVSSPATSLT